MHIIRGTPQGPQRGATRQPLSQLERTVPNLDPCLLMSVHLYEKPWLRCEKPIVLQQLERAPLLKQQGEHIHTSSG